MSIRSRFQVFSMMLSLLFVSFSYSSLGAYESEHITFDSHQRQNWVSKFLQREAGHRTLVISGERGRLGSIYSGKRGAKIRHNFDTEPLTKKRNEVGESDPRSWVKILSQVRLYSATFDKLGQPLMGAVTMLNGAHYALVWLKTSPSDISPPIVADSTEAVGVMPAADGSMKDGAGGEWPQEDANLQRVSSVVQGDFDSVDRYLRHRPASGALLQLAGQNISFNFSAGKFGGLHLPQVPDAAVLLRLDRIETSVLKVYHITKTPLLGVAVVEAIYDILYDLAFADLQEILHRNPDIRFKCDRHLTREEPPRL